MTRRPTQAHLAERKKQRQKAERQALLTLLPFGALILLLIFLDALPRLLGK